MGVNTGMVTVMDPLDRLTEAQAGLTAATTERIDAIKAAREAGHTWRQIAAALDMTERGVMKLMAGRR